MRRNEVLECPWLERQPLGRQPLGRQPLERQPQEHRPPAWIRAHSGKAAVHMEEGMQLGFASVAAKVHGKVEVSRRQFTATTMTVTPSELFLNSQSTAQIVIPGDGAEAFIYHTTEQGEMAETKISGRTISILPPDTCCRVMWQREAALTTFSLADDLCLQIRRDLALRNKVLCAQLAVIDPILWHLGREVRRMLLASSSPTGMYLDSLAVVLCQHTLGTYTQREVPVGAIGALPMYKLRRVIEFIENNLSEDITFRDIAAHVNVSPFHFARVFKLSTGTTPHRFLTEKRMKVAQQRLIETDDAIASIAYQLGFRSQSHFTSVFSKYTGVTPKAYRKPG